MRRMGKKSPTHSPSAVRWRPAAWRPSGRCRRQSRGSACRRRRRRHRHHRLPWRPCRHGQLWDYGGEVTGSAGGGKTGRERELVCG